MKRKKAMVLFLTVLLLSILLCGCFPGDGANTPTHVAGFSGIILVSIWRLSAGLVVWRYRGGKTEATVQINFCAD